MANATATRTKKPTVGSLIDGMHELRNKKRDLAAEEKLLNAQLDELEAKLMAQMDAEGLTKSTGKFSTASITESSQFNFEKDTGFDAFMAYVAKTKQFHLVQRRVSVEAVREVFGKKGAVPGLVPYTKRVIGLRDL